MSREESHLTVIDLDLENKRARTPPGMAHWAGTGPSGTTCRECLEYSDNGYYSANSKYGSTLKPGTCHRYEKMMNKEGPSIPYNTASCKYFLLNDTPKPIQQPQRS